MDKHSILRAFNEHFSEFMQDVIRVFPNDNNLQACKLAIEKMRKANPKLIMTAFTQEFVYKYRDQISSNNLDFFINNDYSDDLENASNSSLILEKINMLRDPIRNMNDTDKDKTTQYMQNLMKLSDLYCN